MTEEIEILLKRIKFEEVKEHCLRYLYFATQVVESPIINLEEAIVILKKMNTGRFILVADYLDALAQSTEQESIRYKFLELAILWSEWQISRFSSASSLDFEHPVYQQIIELGEPVVPFLLEGLEKRTGDWFYALKIIAAVNPVPLQLRYELNMAVVSDVWLDWGRSKGYRW